MRATELLRRDHRHIEHLLTMFASAPRRPRTAKINLFELIDHALTLHESLEEQRFFPSVERSPSRAGRLAEMRQQHQALRTLLLELRRTTTLPTFDKLMRELDRLARRHFREEEEEIFLPLEELMQTDALERLGASLQAHKTRLAESLHIATSGALG